jgi:hypothetical protein
MSDMIWNNTNEEENNNNIEIYIILLAGMIWGCGALCSRLCNCNQNNNLMTPIIIHNSPKSPKEKLIKAHTKYNSNMHTDKECSICLDEYNENDSITILKCNHYFHEYCLEDWFYKKENCPLCRVEQL